MTVAANESADAEQGAENRNSRRITWGIAVAALVLIALGSWVFYRYLQIDCLVHIARAEVEGNDVILRIEARSRDGIEYLTLQKLRGRDSEVEAAWVRDIEVNHEDHWRFPHRAAADIVIPLTDVSTLQWNVKEGDSFSLEEGDELPLLSGQIRKRGYDMDYLFRVKKKE